MGLARVSVTLWENGQTRSSLDNLPRLAKLFVCRLIGFLTGA
jgi:hypothetical protein